MTLDTRFSETIWPEDDKIADALIAACMIDRDAAEKAVELLTPDDMPDTPLRQHKAIFAAITAIVRRGRKPAAPLVAEEMRRAGTATGPGHAESLAKLAANHTAGIAVEDYCRILQRYALRRRLKLAGHKLVDLSQDDSRSTEEFIPAVEVLIKDAVGTASGGDEPRQMGEVIREQLERHKARKRGEVDGLRTGYVDVDAILCGLKPGEMTIVAARPSVGKTTLAQNFADNMAKAGLKPYFASAEMPSEQVANRVIAAEGMVDAQLLTTGMMSDNHWRQVEEKLSKSGLLEAKYWIDDTSQTVAQIRAKAIRYQRLYGLDVLFVDYLQQLRSSGAYRGQRVNEVSEISGDLKRLAKELRVPVIALSQLSRDVEKRGKGEDKRPMLSDLRDSGSIEQDADAVVFLYRESYYDKESTDFTTEIIVAKNRNGPLGVAKLLFMPELTKFVSLDRKHG